MKLEVKQNCPLDSFNPCRELECAWFMKIQGKNPNDGKDIEEWGCAMSWLPILLVENAQQSRSTGAAVESFRNEMVVANAENIKALITTAQIQSEIQSKKQLKIVE
tara:strand:+ start:111 stop:428 length:318 start_codon:yes stop_codon:yes gene_type:complete